MYALNVLKLADFCLKLANSHAELYYLQVEILDLQPKFKKNWSVKSLKIVASESLMFFSDGHYVSPKYLSGILKGEFSD